LESTGVISLAINATLAVAFIGATLRAGRIVERMDQFAQQMIVVIARGADHGERIAGLEQRAETLDERQAELKVDVIARLVRIEDKVDARR
jgi:hypothetical protein